MHAPDRPEIVLRLEGGEEIGGSGPVVIVGPNGSGKTRQSRTLAADVKVEFVNALRNTRVAPELPAMGRDNARNQYRASRDQARSQHWELSMSEFDSMLANLLAENAMADSDFVRRYREHPGSVGPPPVTPLSRVTELWREVFTGRDLLWREWHPMVRSTTTGQPLEYQGHQMSDGEKAALYVAAVVFSADPGVVLVVDEPETHFHSLLAVRLWNVFLQNIGADIVRAPEEGPWAPGYYSLSFRDPEGIRLELNHVPGRGLMANGSTFDPAPDHPLSGREGA
ncbi:MAG: uncharacterized protein JWM53_4542 [bacterium]|nr:uncharacterized protein [bacterium]